MEKEPQPDSLSAVTVKEYASSEVYSSEPPPAYHRQQPATAVQVARIAAITIVVVTFTMGIFLLASSYVQANATCAHLQQELMLLQEAAERFQPPEALVQDEQTAEESKVNFKHSKESKEETKTTTSKASNDENESDDNSLNYDEDEESDEINNSHTPIHFKLPLQLDFDDLAGALIEKNQKSRMNCVVEKKRADEVIDHQPKTLRLPFGLNLTTDPRYEHVTGEKMAIYCESGNEQSHTPSQQQNDEVLMHIQPIIIPLNADVMQQQQMPPHQVPRLPFNLKSVAPPQQSPPHRMGPIIPPHIIAQHVAQIQRVAAEQAAHAQQQQQQQHQQPSQQTQMFHHPQMPMHQPEGHPQIQMVPQVARFVPQPGMRVPMSEAVFSHSQRLPIPEEVLTQINRLPHEDVIAIQVSEESDDQNQEQDRAESAENRVAAEEQRQNVPPMNARQAFARNLPVQIPIQMMPQEMPQAAPSQMNEQHRPHFLQPRSIRSVDNPLIHHREKRVKRCSCDCAC